MRDPERIERILHKIKLIWEKNPDQRLGQLLINYGFGRISEPLMWNAEDDNTEKNLDKMIKELGVSMI